GGGGRAEDAAVGREAHPRAGEEGGSRPARAGAVRVRRARGRPAWRRPRPRRAARRGHRVLAEPGEIRGVNAADAGTITLGGDLTVNRLGFGAMRITGQGIWGEPRDRGEAKRVLRRAIDLGVNFI